MSKSLFQSPKKALLFAALTVVSVVMLVGTEEEEGALIEAAATLKDGSRGAAGDQPDRFGQPAPARRTSRGEPDDFAESGFTSDDELIDDTSGFDPTPFDTESVDMDPAEGDMYIIEDDF